MNIDSNTAPMQISRPSTPDNTHIYYSPPIFPVKTVALSSLLEGQKESSSQHSYSATVWSPPLNSSTPDRHSPSTSDASSDLSPQSISSDTPPASPVRESVGRRRAPPPAPCKKPHRAQRNYGIDIQINSNSQPELLFNGKVYPLRFLENGEFHNVYTLEGEGSLIVDGEEIPFDQIVVKQAHKKGNLDFAESTARLDLLGILNWIRIIWHMNAKELSSVNDGQLLLERVSQIKQEVRSATEAHFQEVVRLLRELFIYCEKAGVDPHVARPYLLAPNGVQLAQKIKSTKRIENATAEDLLPLRKLLTFMAINGHDASQGEVIDIYPRNFVLGKSLCCVDLSFPEDNQDMVERTIADVVMAWAKGNENVATYLLQDIPDLTKQTIVNRLHELCQQSIEHNGAKRRTPSPTTPTQASRPIKQFKKPKLDLNLG